LRCIRELAPRQLIEGHTTLTENFTIEALAGLEPALTELHEFALARIGENMPLPHILDLGYLPALLRDHPAAVVPYLVRSSGSPASASELTSDAQPPRASRRSRLTDASATTPAAPGTPAACSAPVNHPAVRVRRGLGTPHSPPSPSSSRSASSIRWRLRLSRPEMHLAYTRSSTLTLLPAHSATWVGSTPALSQVDRHA
jgi:hypothetical protein